MRTLVIIRVRPDTRRMLKMYKQKRQLNNYYAAVLDAMDVRVRRDLTQEEIIKVRARR